MRLREVTQSVDLRMFAVQRYLQFDIADLTSDIRFVSAPDSRSRLNIERCMLSRLLTWHQVMPEFVDFMLAFGVSEHSKDFLYSGFRSEMNLSDDCKRLILPSLGRSGREIRLCHILRSVERVEEGSQKNWPWSLRPSVTYHSFDAESGKSVWMIVKANNLIKNRIKDSCEDQDLYKPYPDSAFDNSFESTLRTHLVLCSWAGENWRWYINFIEQQIQDLTRGALTEQADASEFSFADLQRVHFVEEKANEALLVLEANAAVIRELCTFYTTAEDALSAASLDRKPISSAIAMFQRHLNVTAKDLAMQQARSQMLLKLLADRKSLVSIVSGPQMKQSIEVTDPTIACKHAPVENCTIQLTSRREGSKICGEHGGHDSGNAYNRP